MVSPDVILETSHIFIAIIQHLFSTRIRRVDFKCLIFPEPRHVSDALLWSERGEEKNGAFFSKTSKQASNLCFESVKVLGIYVLYIS